ncbi:PDR/VanB family oxidoreductase [Salinispirillum sp. LH 10-3-1]|uniref:PDR/VanB family oxidoreductase n=1 Tax=Salinispirillum sp. LH 10-3-1 TaxID=2952525 RepID=A0AB38YGV1_9GAMM
MSKTSLSMIVQVRQKTQAAADIACFELVDPHGRELPAFTAGAHIDVQADDEHLRQYSLSNASSERQRYQIAVLREPQSRGGSVAMHDKVKEGDYLQISAPRNHFAVDHDAKRSVLFAGGIGITPILAMAEEIHAHGGDFELHYSASTPENAAFVDYLKAAPFADKVTFHFTKTADGKRIDLAAMAAKPEVAVHIYVCGPEAFNDAVINTYEAAGWPKRQLHTEYFVGVDADTSGDGSFEVELARSGVKFTIPADKTVADVLIDNDIDLLTSCEQGICGTCVTKVLEGTPEHRDRYLTDDERAANDQFTPCCSRSKSKVLVIDL